MADLPILFSGSMVRAILREIEKPGTGKTQTRRIVKPQPTASGKVMLGDNEIDAGEWQIRQGWFLRISPGDRLYVREHWRTSGSLDSIPPRDLPRTAAVLYNADEGRPVWAGKHRQAMHMPKWASRITLIVDVVKVERLQHISEADAVAEGCFKGKASGRVFVNQAAMHLGGDEWGSARDWYADLWELIHGPGAWDANPWVVAYTFRPILSNIDQIGGAA